MPDFDKEDAAGVDTKRADCERVGLEPEGNENFGRDLGCALVKERVLVAGHLVNLLVQVLDLGRTVWTPGVDADEVVQDHCEYGASQPSQQKRPDLLALHVLQLAKAALAGHHCVISGRQDHLLHGRGDVHVDGRSAGEAACESSGGPSPGEAHTPKAPEGEELGLLEIRCVDKVLAEGRVALPQGLCCRDFLLSLDHLDLFRCERAHDSS